MSAVLQTVLPGRGTQPPLAKGGSRWVLLAGVVVGAWCCTARADKAVAPAELAVDQVSVRGGPRLVGAILGREADGTLAIAVRRAWLKTAHARFYEQALKDETAETRAALLELGDRIAEWRKSRAEERELDFFLGKEAERVDAELKALDEGKRTEDAPFLVVDIAAAKIEHIVNQPPQRKRVAATAWREGLDGVETRSATSLSQELAKQKIELADDADELLDSLPPRRQNEAAWAARRAIVEYRFRKPLDFQGTGDVVVRTGDAPKAADLGQLIDGILKSVGGDALGGLTDPPAGGPPRKPPGNGGAANKWLASASQTAEADGVDGFRVTRVNQDLAAKRAAVETLFVARLPDGQWRGVWQRTESADASKPRPDVEQQISKDPQVRSALELFKALGVGGEEQIRMAVRFGAATSEAQKAADSRFFEFRDRFLRRLDGPVLRVPPVVPAKAGRK